MIATGALGGFDSLTRHRQQGGDKAVEVKLLAVHGEDPRRSGAGRRAPPLPVGLAPPQTYAAASEVAVAGAPVAALSRCLPSAAGIAGAPSAVAAAEAGKRCVASAEAIAVAPSAIGSRRDGEGARPGARTTRGTVISADRRGGKRRPHRQNRPSS